VLAEPPFLLSLPHAAAPKVNAGSSNPAATARFKRKMGPSSVK
jgi:hypothetical protein